MNGKDRKSNPLFAFDHGRLRATRWRDVLVRFGFGATISVVAGAVSVIWGARVGGVLLAFPAILPATLTLIEKEEGEERTFHDLQGTVAGAVGLVCFGVTAAFTIGHVSMLVALALALLSWCAVAGIVYVLWSTWLRRRGVQL